MIELLKIAVPNYYLKKYDLSQECVIRINRFYY